MYMTLRGQTLPMWIGYGQAKKDFNCIPKKGSKAAKILRPNLLKIDLKNEDGSPKLDKAGNPDFYMKLTFKGASVFNIEDLVGLNDKGQAKLDKAIADFKEECNKEERPLSERCEEAHKRLMIFSKDLKGGLIHGGDQAYYQDQLDHVVMPERASFINDEEYLSTLSHEFSHATGHKDRLNRKWLNEYRTYRPLEELTAEFSSVLIANRLQITCNTKNHAAYISSWAKSVKNAKNPSQALMKVFSNSVKAANLVIGEQ
jgi:antirestriction protein ArdC